MNFLIAIGGSGIRCLSSFLHFCAMGLGSEDIHILVVEPDTTHGNLEQLRGQIDAYQRCQSYLKINRDDPIFSSMLHEPEKSLNWSPVEGESLSKLLNYRAGFARGPLGSYNDFCNLFFSQNELQFPLDRGFRGRPSVGAIAMSRATLETEVDHWGDFFEKINAKLGKGQSAKIFVFASIFGGTGASGFPVIGQLIRDEINKKHLDSLQLGGALLLPYFQFSPNQDERNMDELYADSKYFLINTKAALWHYNYRWNIHDQSPYNATYYLGENRPYDQKKFSEGGPSQKNCYHYIELFAALAAYDFFNNDRSGDYISAPNQSSYDPPNPKHNWVRWQDIPLSAGDRQIVKYKWCYFTTLAQAYMEYFYDLLTNPKFEKHCGLIPWYRDHFIKQKDRLILNLEDELRYYLTQYYFPWLLDLHTYFDQTKTRHPLSEVELFNVKDITFKVENNRQNVIFPVNSIEKMLYPHENNTNKRNAYDRIWSYLCAQKYSSGSGMGKFIRLMHVSIKRFVDEQYKNLNVEI